MRKMMNKVVGNMKVTAAKAAMLLKDKKGENYVDTAVKILIAVVIGALLPEEFRKCLTTQAKVREEVLMLAPEGASQRTSMSRTEKCLRAGIFPR